MIKSNQGELGLIFDLSGVDQGSKPINGPKEVTVDANGNIMVFSKEEGAILKYKLKLENNGKNRFRR